MHDRSCRPDSRSRFFLPASALVAFALGLLVTALLFLSINAFERHSGEAEFERRANNRFAAVREGLQDSINVLSTVTRLFMTVPQVGRAQFDTFTRPMLAQNPQIHLLTFQRLVEEGERDRFEAQRRTRFPGFEIGELAHGAKVRAASRSRYLVIDYLEPMAGNENVLGLDTFSRKDLDGALRRACSTGQASMTGLYPVMLDNTLQKGAVLLTPVYRDGAVLARTGSNCAHVSGYTSAAFSSSRLFAQALAARRALGTGFDVSVYAGRGPREQNLAFRHGAAPAPAPDASFLSSILRRHPDRLDQSFEIAGQPWYVVVSASKPALLDDRLGSLLVLAGGLCTSLLVAAYLRVLAARSRSVNRMVRERTAALHETSATLQVRERAIEACVNSIIITSARAPHHAIEYVNPAFEEMTGYATTEMIGLGFSVLWRDDADQDGVRALVACADAQQQGHALLRICRKDGTLLWSEAYFAPVRNEDGQVEHFVVAIYDITQKKCYEEELERQARHDNLTGLANRTLLRERLREAIVGAAREQRAVWVMFVDLDHFKFVNDSLGHSAGDKFLCVMARRLREAVRHGDTVARHGGDEFVLVLREGAHGALNQAALERIVAAIAQPVTIDGHEFFIGSSAGIAAYPADSDDPDSLIEFADLAMYRAKQLGRNNLQFYTAEMNAQAQERLRLEGALRNALEAQQFELHYQPQVDLRSGRIVGMEALLRWWHPELGMVAPGRFIALAEETGMIVPIGAWVMRSACAQAQAWREAGLGEIRMAVNLSARQFNEAGLVDSIAAILAHTGLPARCLDIELTESLVMTDVARAVEILTSMHALGLTLSIDDFGTGYSSLAYLNRFPIDVLKIDQSFVREIAEHASQAAIVDAIISMAHSMGMRVIAEGVETEAQCDYLARNMCDEIQGYLFSRPLPAGEMAQLLAQQRCLPERLLRVRKRARTLLLVDDEPGILNTIKRRVSDAGYLVLTAPHAEAALGLLATQEVDVVLSDQRMPGMSGVEFLRTVKRLYPHTVRIVLSGFGDLQLVTDAINEGAIYKFLTKPWDDAQLRAHIEEAFLHKEMADDNRRLDLELRTANHGLAQLNRQMEEGIRQQREQIAQDRVALELLGAALGNAPMICLDQEQAVAFANPAAHTLFSCAGSLAGVRAEQFMAPVLQALRAAGQAQTCIVELDGVRYDIVARGMGKEQCAHAKLITFIRLVHA
ncbi:MAG: EAL domain-containing protein [Telluria sp.]|nr:EAL domain-containing protein [Telluria sp.]